MKFYISAKCFCCNDASPRCCGGSRIASFFIFLRFLKFYEIYFVKFCEILHSAKFFVATDESLWFCDGSGIHQ